MIYRDILITAFITYATPETLMKTSAVKPYDFCDFQDSGADAVGDTDVEGVVDGDTVDIDPYDVPFDFQMTDSEGLSVYSAAYYNS